MGSLTIAQPDPRGQLLHAFDAHAEAHGADGIHPLSDLAGAIRAHVGDWGRRVEGLDAARRPFDERRAAALVLESVFDEILTPSAWRVLAAALDLARTPA